MYFEEKKNSISDYIENIQIIISVFIVLIIAWGIYSYSKRDLEKTEEGEYMKSCEEYGNRTNLDNVPLRCKRYWKEEL